MKQILIAAAALTLVGSSAALAQEHDDRGQGGYGDHRGDEHRDGGYRGDDHRGDDRRGDDYRGGDHRDGGYRADDHRGDGFRGQDHRDGGYRGELHAFGRFSYHGRDFDRFRVSPFRYPAGWGYRQWGVGQYLPRLLLSPSYFIRWDTYGLAPPGPRLRWMRYGPDALLVNTYTGQVVDVAYGVFWW